MARSEGPKTISDEATVAPARPAELGVGLVAGRYNTVYVLGSGGWGTVWAATDLVTGQPVAIKLVPALTGPHLAGIRREITALRRARFPGVVRLRDEGMHGAEWFIVLDRVDGEPFPGPAKTWPELRPIAASILRTLAVVHAAGLVHLDLKPSNVLVGVDGQTTLLDFGLAGGRAVSDDTKPSNYFTISYASPEQASNRVVDSRSDLYSFGVMLQRALTCWEYAAIPHAVTDTVRQLLSEHPDDRPQSAADVLNRLGCDCPPLIGAGAPDLTWEQPITVHSLRERFVGPNAFLHLREDAANLLWKRAGSSADAVNSELARWLQHGYAHWDGDRIAMSREGLDRAAWTTSAIPSQDASQIAAEWIGQGRGRAAWTLVEVGLASARSTRDHKAELALLQHAAVIGLALESPSALDPVLYELGRAQRNSTDLDQLEVLVRAARAVRTGSGDRARDLLLTVRAIQDERLEIWRQTLHYEVARTTDPTEAERVIDVMASWAKGKPAREGKRLGLLGDLRYRQSRFSEAADCQLRASTLKMTPDGRLSAKVNAAGALLEVPDLHAAASLAAEAAIAASELRHPRYEALAVWIERSAQYRLGNASIPRPELVDAAFAVSPYLGGLHALNEAAIAWRGSNLRTACDLIDRAVDAFSRPECAPQRLLAEALALAIKAPSNPEVGADLAARALTCGVPDLGVQALGLVLLGGSCSVDRSDLIALAACRPESQWSQRLDVLSFDEATGRQRVQGPDFQSPQGTKHTTIG